MNVYLGSYISDVSFERLRIRLQRDFADQRTKWLYDKVQHLLGRTSDGHRDSSSHFEYYLKLLTNGYH